VKKSKTGIITYEAAWVAGPSRILFGISSEWMLYLDPAVGRRLRFHLYRIPSLIHSSISS
jgi:hypothetical protein